MASANLDSVNILPATLSGYGSKTSKTSSRIHYSSLLIIDRKKCEERHYELETSTNENDLALWENVNVIFDSEKRVSSEIICTETSIEELGTCPGGCKIDGA